jgi:diguanylate cyclase (GGDEF)-like protein
MAAMSGRFAGFLAHGFLCFLPLLLAGPAGADRDPLSEVHLVSAPGASALGDGVVTALAQDGRGFLWVGNPAGLQRYDGYRFKFFPQGQGSTFVRALLVDHDGALWVGTDGDGLARFDPQTERWTRLLPVAGQPQSITTGGVRALARAPDGGIWLGTLGGGLDYLDATHTRFTHHRRADGLGLPDDRIQSLLLDSRQTLWVGTWNGLVRRRPGQARFEPVAAAGAGQVVTALREAPDGRIWLGTRGGDVLSVDPLNDRVQRAEEEARADRRADPVAALQPTPAGEVWVGRQNSIELRSAGDGRLLQTVRRDRSKPWSLGGNGVSALLSDASGLLWIGSYGGGLQRVLPGDQGLWLRRDDESADSPLWRSDIRSVLQLRSGAIWLGTQAQGIAILDAQLRSVAAIRPGGRFAGGLMAGLAQTRDGSVWAGGDTGLYRFDPSGRLLQTLNAGRGAVRRLLASRDGSLWVASQDGLYRWWPETGLIERVGLVGGAVSSGAFNALAEAADGSLWAGGDAGLFQLPAGENALHPVSGLGAAPGATILGLLFDARQTLWVDSAQGLYRRDAWDGRQARFSAVAQAHGFGGRSMGANLLADEAGRLWTQRGMFDPATGRYTALGQADGVDFGTAWFRAYAKLQDGRLLFGGSNSLLVVEPARFRPWHYQAPIVATELRIDGRPQALAMLWPGLTLAAGQRAFSIEFAALDFSAPSQNLYRHRLRGYDETWVSTGSELRIASYANLAPGHYELEVQGSNRVGDWSAATLALPIEVLPFWWQTWWARGLALLALGLSFWGLLQLRTAYLRRRERVLELMVGERTRELETLSAALQEASLSDPLTGLRNRRYLSQHIEADVALSLREGSDLIFFLLDIDHFKQLNDRHGHAAGDAVLMQMRARLQAVFRESDHLVRWGGEEFLIVARGTARAHAAELAERARATVADSPFILPGGHPLSTSCSVGFACFPLHPRQPQLLSWGDTVGLADAALYAAKNAGRDRWVGVLGLAEGQDLPRPQPAAAWLASGELQLQSSEERSAPMSRGPHAMAVEP